MKARPITILAPQIHLIGAGLLTRLFRPAGPLLSAVRPGDRLWVREPFMLERCFDHISPSQAAERGARPLFIAGPVTGSLQPGRTRFAREMPRIWHRQHLVVTAITLAPLQSITDEDVRKQGFNLREAFAENWNLQLSLAGAGRTWAVNPTVLVIDFNHIASPVDAAAPPRTGLCRSPVVRSVRNSPDARRLELPQPALPVPEGSIGHG